MGRLREMPPVLPVCGVLSGGPEPVARSREMVEQHLGPVLLEGGPWAFDHTDYYTDEMGPGLQRWFWAFDNPIDPARLPHIKLATQRIETRLADPAGRRRVNLDPGYIELGKLVLASTKNHAHRIYLSKGIFGEVTLHYLKDRGWTATPWTFPDFASGRYNELLDRARRHYIEALHEKP
ncbi:MAG: DUF4416 family protein [Planctomycetota bacterium]